MLYPLMPILLTSVLGAPAAIVGIIEGIAEGVAALVKYVSGRTSDRVGRKPAVATGYGLAAVGKVIIAAASVWPGAPRPSCRPARKGIRGAPAMRCSPRTLRPRPWGRCSAFTAPQTPSVR